MARGKGLANLLFVLGADVREFQTEMRKATRDMQRFGRNMMDVGKDMTRYATLPITAFATGAVMSFRTVNEALKQVEAGVKSTGGAAGFTTEELKKMAKSAGDVANVFSADILKDVTAQLLTFTNVTGPTFERAQMSILDVSARMGTGMSSSAIMIGKALNDPIQGLTALRRVGIQFSEQQEAMVKTMVEVGDVVSAQGVILEELERQFGGSAEASGDAFTKIGIAAKELGASFGELIQKWLTPLIGQITGMINWISNLNDQTKSWVLGIGAVVAAIGPLMIALGFMAKSIIPMFISGLAATKIAFAKLTAVMLANPYVALGALLAAVAASLLIFRNRTKEAEEAQWKLGDALKNVNIELGRQIFESLAMGARIAADGSIELTKSLDDLARDAKKLTKQELESLKLYLENAYSEAARSAANATDDLNRSILEQDMATFEAALKLIISELNKFNNTITETSQRVGIITALNDELKRLRDERAAATTGRDIAFLNDQIAETEERLGRLQKLSGEWFRVAEMGPLPTMDSKPAPMKIEVDAEDAKMQLRDTSNHVIALGEQFEMLSHEAMIAIDMLTNSFFDLGGAIADAFAGIEGGFHNMINSMLAGLRQIIHGLLAKAIAGAIAGEAQKGLAGLITGAIAVGGIMSLWNSKVPKFAAGGIVPPGYPGDTYPALLTSGEKVIPPHKLDSVGGGIDSITVYVKGKLQGQELLLLTERAQVSRKRTLGR